MRRTLSLFNAKALVELREYKVKPGCIDDYMRETTKTSDLRKSLVPLKIFTMPETGGFLNTPSHFYCYESPAQRQQMRGEMAKSREWLDYLDRVRPMMIEQHSSLFYEAPLRNDITGESMITGMRSEKLKKSGSSPVFEYRRYQLGLGYDAVPKFLKIYEAGVRHKLENVHESTELVSLLYSDTGTINQVIEVWHHGEGLAAMDESRVKGRTVSEWTSAVQAIVPLSTSFNTSINNVASFSPFR